MYTTGPAQKTSPLPCVDDFIEMILKKWTPDVQIRKWKVVEENGRIISIIYYVRYKFVSTYNLAGKLSLLFQYWKGA